MATTKEIIDKIAEEQGLTKVQVKAVVDGVFQQITDAAKQGAETSIHGFGKFKVTERPERTGRNPASGATITIPSSRKLVFQPAKTIKDTLNG